MTMMGPPPSRNPTSTTEPETLTMDEPATSSLPVNTSMGPPPPKNPDILQSDSPQTLGDLQSTPDVITVEETIEIVTDSLIPEQTVKKTSQQCQNVVVPYTIPPWSGRPCHQFYLEVLKDGLIVEQFDVHEKGAYIFGRVNLCDFVLEHPTISRFHAVLQFKGNGRAYLYDLGSTHGTSINKSQVKQKDYVDLHVGDVIRFGHSSRLYIFQGPTDLMPPEKDLKRIRHAKIKEEMHDREASLRRARQEAALADGISWGMGEDAIEEAEDDDDEITWQTYKGQLTEKQEKTRDKIIKRTEKIANMKKEIDAIRAKDIAQGGLTQGQQTQIARNEQRISQILEELENLEETLNESVRESMGARSGKVVRGKNVGTTEDEEEIFSDDDEFYDRTKKPVVKKAGENQAIETADTLLDKRGAILKEMEDKKELLLVEKNMMESKPEVESHAGDPLDAYMSGLSSQLVLDKTEQIQKELTTLQSELDRVLYLLKIADPTGEAIKKRDSNLQDSKSNISEIPGPAFKKPPPFEPKRSSGPEKPESSPMKKEVTKDAIVESSNASEAKKIVIDATEGKTTEGKTAMYTVIKPQWLGAVDDKKTESSQQVEVVNTNESEEFVDYKDRKTILANVDLGIEDAAPGLIIRKIKQVENFESSDNKAPKQATSASVGAELNAEDAVALLLKHARGYHAEDDEGRNEGQDLSTRTHSKDKKSKSQSSKSNKKPKRVLGPEKPSFLEDNSDYDSSWVPPEGQSGDGRTSLNDRLGY